MTDAYNEMTEMLELSDEVFKAAIMKNTSMRNYECA